MTDIVDFMLFGLTHTAANASTMGVSGTFPAPMEG